MRKILVVLLFIFVFYERSVSEMEISSLPAPRLKSTASFEETLLKRRSVRSFSDTELTMEEIGQLLWAGQGITQSSTGYKTAPSAGATYPLQIYVMTREGLSLYIPDGHKLKLVRSGDLRASLSRAALGQGFIGQAPVDIIITAIYPRTTQRYGKRGIRYVHIEVGHVAQNVHLQAVALGFGSVPVGAFTDEEVKRVLSLPDEEVPCYIIPVGHVKRR